MRCSSPSSTRGCGRTSGANSRRDADIPPARRELQRDYVNRLAAAAAAPGAASRVDSRSLMRVEAQALLARIRSALRRPGLNAETRAHLQDSADTLAQALAAPLQRAGA